jgi:hypothetical protein
MTREEAVRLLQENMDTIRSYGVRRIGLFGSVVRDEATEESDVDVVVEFEEGKALMKNVLGLIDFLEELFGREIDLLTPDGIETIRIPYIKREIKKELIYI